MTSKESKSDRFTRLAESRVNKIIKMFKLLKNLSGSNYEYTKAQVTRIFSVLQTELNQVRKQYYGTKKKRFSLADSDVKSKSLDEYPDLILPLSNGSYLRAIAINTDKNPALNVYLCNSTSEELQQICFVEGRQRTDSESELYIGVYQYDMEDTAYYGPFMAERSYEDDAENN